MGDIIDTVFLWFCYAVTAITYFFALIAPVWLFCLIIYAVWKDTFGCRKK